MFIFIGMAPKTHHYVLQVAGAFSAIAFVISLRQIISHVTNFTNPAVQKNVIRVLTMVPVRLLYSIVISS